MFQPSQFIIDPSIYPQEQVEIKRLAMLSNPKSGKGKALHLAGVAEKIFRDAGIDVVGISGASPEASRQLAADMIADEDIDALVVCGGDGLINLALQAQANSKVPLGIIPAGTGNDHARARGIPSDVRRAAETIIRGFTSTCDLGKVTNPQRQEKYYGTICCAGFDSLVTDRTNTLKWPTGPMRYNLAILLEFIRFHSIPTRIEMEEGLTINDNITLSAFGVTSTYGAGMRVCPHADHFDGLLDVTIFRRLNRRKSALNVNRFFTGKFEGFKEAELYRTRKLTIHMPEINVYADGDLMFPSPVTVECVPGAGRFIVPRV